MNALLTAIVFWLSASFGLPANYDHPRIEFVPAAEITAVFFRGLAGQRRGAETDPADQRQIVSVYDDTRRTIYLRDDWTGRTPAELSVLIHEMVHHLQAVGKLRFACPQEREQLAYQAQQRWLGLFGRDLEGEFEIDPFTLFVLTRCL